MERARRIVVSYPDELGEWSREQIFTDRFRSYLRRVHETAEVGEEWVEFVDVGCCGDSPDIPLHVERVEGGSRLDAETEVAFEPREASVRSGWEVQSRAGPPKERS